MRSARTPKRSGRCGSIAMELILANHEQNCPTCPKSASCQLAGFGPAAGRRSRALQVARISRSRSTASSLSLVRNPNKCILCGDCVRVCEEIQGIGAIDFAYRGAAACVVPAFGKDLKRRRMRQLRAVRRRFARPAR